jgi:hypothetical protein
MGTFLVGISWCDPEEVAACKRVGIDDDAHCSTGLFVDSASPNEAVSWAETVAAKFMEFLFHAKQYPQEILEISCWVEETPESSAWKHCLGFFQRISVGQFPDFQKMTTEAYSEWCRRAGVA